MKKINRAAAVRPMRRKKKPPTFSPVGWQPYSSRYSHDTPALALLRMKKASHSFSVRRYGEFPALRDARDDPAHPGVEPEFSDLVAQLGDFFCLEQLNPFWATYLRVSDFEIL